MAHKLTADDAREALSGHVRERAELARRRYGPRIDMAALERILDDREIVRYPVALRFDAEPLEPGEFAFAAQRGTHPSEGFDLFVHPHFRERVDVLPLLVAYHLVCVNYGDIVTHEQAECFGATLLGIDVDEYYERLCALADEIAPADPSAPES
ncbi:MAG: hypothetical protein D6744_13335 [Planctomycetota bacterium]|nr:MAG: hypothetical protein D6744_13335 [Planctomycetota bacterium]